MTQRIPMGTYSKLTARILRWMLSKWLPTGVTILFRGRGPRGGRIYSIPLKDSTRFALYLVDERRELEKAKEARAEQRARRASFKRIAAQPPIELSPAHFIQTPDRTVHPTVEALSPLNAWERINTDMNREGVN